MKILICNVPLRPDGSKTNYPPLGAMAVIKAMECSGYQVQFYDINLIRPNEAALRDFFEKGNFDIVGISAVVSTSYAYVKKLSRIIKSVSPDATVIVGGRLAISAEILLEFCNVDFCIIGEGEKAIVKLADYIAQHGCKKNKENLNNIRGICFLDACRKPVFTGYNEPLNAEEISDPDYSIIERFSDINNYFISPFVFEQFKRDGRAHEKSRKGKKMATVVSSRGCVNRCTFCHRWQKGIKIFSVDRVIEHIKLLMREYNVGFISFGDESFGVSKGWLTEFVEKVKPLDILYRIGGMCCESVDIDRLKKLKESGCVAVHYGFESGSNRMLKVMEKFSDVESNIKVAHWTYEAGLETVAALVVGMPGENPSTINETTNFLKRITEFLPREPVSSINLLVALPGTPVYEYARVRGFLGKTLKDEEDYLLMISDRGGESGMQLNLTDYPYFVVQSWVRLIYYAVRYHYYRHNNLKGTASPISVSTAFYRLRHIIAFLSVLYANFKENKNVFSKRCIEFIFWLFRPKYFSDYVSLRSYLKSKSNPIEGNDIRLLRLGS